MAKQLLRKKPYLVQESGQGLRISISDLSGIKKGDKYYQVKRDDGTIELIPEDLYLKNPLM